MIYFVVIYVTLTYLTEHGNCLYSSVTLILSYSLCLLALKPKTLGKSIKLTCFKSLNH